MDGQKQRLSSPHFTYDCVVCRFNSVVASSVSTSTRLDPPVGVSGAVEIATQRALRVVWDLHEAQPLTKTQTTPPTCRTPHTTGVKSLPEIPPPGPIGTAQIEHCPADPGAFRATNVERQNKNRPSRLCTRISFKRNILPSGKDGSRLSEGPAPSPPCFLGSVPRGASPTSHLPVSTAGHVGGMPGLPPSS